MREFTLIHTCARASFVDTPREIADVESACRFYPQNSGPGREGPAYLTRAIGCCAKLYR